MQDFLTFLIDAIALASVGYFAVGFALGAAPTRTQPGVIEVAAVTIEDEAIDVPPPLQVLSNFATLNAQQLRRECEFRAIRWRHVHGRDRHLRKPEILAALATIG